MTSFTYNPMRILCTALPPSPAERAQRKVLIRRRLEEMAKAMERPFEVPSALRVTRCGMRGRRRGSWGLQKLGRRAGA